MKTRIEYGNRLTPLLLLACIALSIILSLQWHNRVRIEHDKAVHADQHPTLDAGTGYTAPAIVAFSDILERPLFTEGRTPPAPAQPIAVAVKSTPLRLQVEGVAITPETRIAVVRNLDNRDLLRLSEGSTFQGWVLQTVDSRGASFIKDGEVQEFVLDPLNNTFRRY
jgi:type II secretory pathway component PulC